jgi:transposase
MDGLLLEERRTANDAGDPDELLHPLRLELTLLRGGVQSLQREHLELRQRAGYWKAQHARALERIATLQEENEHLRGEQRRLQDQLFGQKSEKQSPSNRSNHLPELDEDETVDSPGAAKPQRLRKGPKRRDYCHLPERPEVIDLPPAEQVCPHCGAPWLQRSDTEDSQQIEIEVQAHRRTIRRRRYQATCTCVACQTKTAPAPAKLIPKSLVGTSVWVEILLDKYFSHRPTERLLGAWELVGLDLAASTVNGGLQRLTPLFEPLHELLRQRNQRSAYQQADETR